MSVEVAVLGKAGKASARRLKAKAARVLKILRRDEAELSLALVGNVEIQELNRRYRRKNEATDVLSFPLGDTPAQGPAILGDVIISVEKARSQARDRGRTLEEELETLLIHGILHLLGYDHEISPKEARRMQRMEKRVRRSLCRPRVKQV